MNVSFALHVIGVVLWFAGLLTVTRFLQVYAAATGERSVLERTLKKSFYVYAVQGMLIVLATGLFQLFFRGIGFYMRQGWFHGKLTFVFVLLGLTVILWTEVAKLGTSQRIHAGKLRCVHIGAGISLIAIVFLTLLGRANI